MADAPGAAAAVVLVVEDNPLLCELAVCLVAEAGFAVLEAGNADEAIAVLAARRDIALLVTDIEMPGSMDGLKLAHLARMRWPSIGLLVVSGRPRPPAGELPTNSSFLAKPYPGATMIAELRALVGTPPDSRSAGDRAPAAMVT